MRTEAGGYRRDYLRALAQRVEVDAKELRIMGSKSVLLRTLVAASGAKSAVFGADSVFRSGAPRSMKMGTIRSPCPYDAAARHSLQSANLRRPAISRYASWGCLPDIAERSGYPPDSGPCRSIPGLT
jgi:hypothetical protein